GAPRRRPARDRAPPRRARGAAARGGRARGGDHGRRVRGGRRGDRRGRMTGPVATSWPRWPRFPRRRGGRSTGPPTREGKAAAARTARRHGLSLPVLADPALAPDVAALARAIAGAGASDACHAAAARIAEAQIDLLRVRRIRAELMAAVLAGHAPI